jgi:predicted DNA repair protein MutK
MPVGSFLALLDDITLQSKIAISKASGVVTDDLALNSNMVTGIPSHRELPVVRAIATGSLINKFALSAGALAISAFAPVWVIPGLLMLGGSYLCYEGVEKVQHMLAPHKHGHGDRKAVETHAMDAETYRAHEKSIIRSAIITDVVLSAEITALTLGGMNVAAPLINQAGVLLATGIGMTVGVYGLVAGIVKMDDAGLLMMKRQGGGAFDRAIRASGKGILTVVPHIMKSLSYIGTAAMFIVGGGIFVHQLPILHDAVHGMTEMVGDSPGVGEALSYALPFAADTLSGVVAGIGALLVVNGAGSVFKGARRLARNPETAAQAEAAREASVGKPQPVIRPDVKPAPEATPDLTGFASSAQDATPPGDPAPQVKTDIPKPLP